jgi:hypothetical protein
VVADRAKPAHWIAVSVQMWLLPAASEYFAKLCSRLLSEWSAKPWRAELPDMIPQLESA